MAKDVCRSVFPGSDATVEKSGKGNNEVFRIKALGNTYFLKFASVARQNLMVYEYRSICQLQKWQLPAPEIVAHATDAPENRWILMRSSGTPLTNFIDAEPNLLFEAGKLLTKYHSHKFETLGRIRNNKIVPRDFCKSRWAPLSRKLSAYASNGFLDPLVAEQIRNRIMEIELVGSGVLSHGELTLPHFVVDAGQIKTAIDWSYMASLPAAYDVSAVELYCDIAGFEFERFLKGYGIPIEEYYGDPNRIACRLIHNVRMFVPNRSKNFAKIKTMLQRCWAEFNQRD